MAKFPSPGAFERRLWAAKKKAEVILAAYHGELHPSWYDCASALLVEPRPNKAGLIAVASTLAGRDSGFRSYRAARDWLVAHRTEAFSTTTVVKEENWGRKSFQVAYQIEAMPRLVRQGAEVYRALGVGRWGQRTLAYAVVCGPYSWVAQHAASAEEALKECSFEWGRVEIAERRLELPFAFQRLLTQAYEKANALLEGWRNRPTVTWSNCANALFSLGLQNPTEAANQAVIGALGIRMFNAQIKLEEFSDRAFPIADDSDGVRTYLAAEPELRRVGVSVTRALQISDDGKRNVIRLVRKGERTFHHSSWGDATVAVHEAIRAWRRQDELRLVTADLVAFLTGKTTGACPLLVRAHSRAAGNCDAGTNQWLRQRGWANRNSIPGVWLVPHLEDQRVKSVVLQLMRQHRVLKSA